MALRVVIVGAGVIGLSCALRLRQAGFHPEIVTREPPGRSTSAVAAAYWYPYKVSNSPTVESWAYDTYAEYKLQLTRGIPGLRMVRLREFFRNNPPEPWWKDGVDNFSILSAHDVPSDYCAAYEYVVPLAETPIYLPWLEEEVRNSGVPTRIAEVQSLTELAANYDLIVNCAGAWAGPLVSNQCAFPIRGQLQLVSPISSSQPEIMIFCEGQDVTYIVRRSGDCVLGGTAEDGDWNLKPDEFSAAAIRRRCERLEPKLKDVTILDNVVGLRPGRHEVRLEIEKGPSIGAQILHNYGHGGAGYTLCWGCANAAVALASS